VSAVGLGIGGLVHPGRRYLVRLHRGWSCMSFVSGHLLLGSGPVLYPARAAAECRATGVGHGASLNDGTVHKSGVDKGLVHMHHSGVIGKVSAPPLAPGKADSQEAAAVVDAAVVADMVAPIALVKCIAAVVPAPIAGRPQGALVGRRHPCAGDPEVAAVRAVAPIARGPHQVRLGAWGLLIHRQLRRCEVHTDEDLGAHRRRNKRKKQRKHQQAGRKANQSHG
jgi:hypothetical protein